MTIVSLGLPHRGPGARYSDYSYDEITCREPGLSRRTLERQILRGHARLRSAA